MNSRDKSKIRDEVRKQMDDFAGEFLKWFFIGLLVLGSITLIANLSKCVA